LYLRVNKSIVSQYQEKKESGNWGTIHPCFFGKVLMKQVEQGVFCLLVGAQWKYPATGHNLMDNTWEDSWGGMWENLGKRGGRNPRCSK